MDAALEAELQQKYTTETILSMQRWTDRLITFRLSRPQGYAFVPGQFARLGLALENGGQVWRAYSMCSDVQDEFLEFYSIVAPGGQFTTRLAQKDAGDALWLDKRALGYFDVARLPDGKDLWLLGTGTGLAPYLSILRLPEVWRRFERIVLVHGVRDAADLSYGEHLRALAAGSAGQFQYLPAVTRGAPAGMLSERIPALLAGGELAAHAGLELSLEHSRFMICGNPKMVSDTHLQLMSMGYKMCRQREPGQLVLENGF